MKSKDKIELTKTLIHGHVRVLHELIDAVESAFVALVDNLKLADSDE